MTAAIDAITLTEKEPAALSSVSVVVVRVPVPVPVPVSVVVVRVVLVDVVEIAGRLFETSQLLHGCPLEAQKMREKHPIEVAVGHLASKLSQYLGQICVLHLGQPPEH